MKFISETIDDKTGDHIFSYEVTEEEKSKLEAFAQKYNLSIDEIGSFLLEKALEDVDSFKKFIKENREKYPKGIPGKPVLSRGDKVGFYLTYEGKEKFYIGQVEIVDAYGSYFKDGEPSYDIMVDDFEGSPTLVKHIAESDCYKV